MATLDINIPDAQIANLATYIGSDAEEDDDRLDDLVVWLQDTVNHYLWEAARSNAAAAAEDPTV